MNKFMKVLFLSIFFSVSGFAYTDVFVGGDIALGSYKITGNEYIDGNMETSFMGAVDVFTGFTTKINNIFNFRMDGVLTYGGEKVNQTNFGAFTLRSGVEVKVNEKVIPYAMIGGGVYGIDPKNAFFAVRGGWEALMGTRFRIKKSLYLNTGVIYSKVIMHYNEKLFAERNHRMQGYVGLVKTF